MNDQIVVLIPAYNPDYRLPLLVRELLCSFRHIVVVDDGSSDGQENFSQLSNTSVVLLRHLSNQGKGAALKTGFTWIMKNLPSVIGVVTADADGQHKLKDIISVAGNISDESQGLVLGVRAFKGDVPIRSRFGNGCTRIVFSLLTGLRIKDTQTGLRGIPIGLLGRIVSIAGNRYEYEMRMLADCKWHQSKPLQIDIETVYLDDNASSHFNPIRDSYKIWSALIKYVIFKR